MSWKVQVTEHRDCSAHMELWDFPSCANRKVRSTLEEPTFNMAAVASVGEENFSSTLLGSLAGPTN